MCCSTGAGGGARGLARTGETHVGPHPRPSGHSPVHLREVEGKPGGYGEDCGMGQGQGGHLLPMSSRLSVDPDGEDTNLRTLICFLKIILMIYVFHYIPVPREHGGTSLNKSDK